MCDSQKSVLLLPNNNLNKDGAILKLKHPKENQSCFVYFNSQDNLLYELLSIKEKHVSWFVDDNVIGDCKLSIGTPLDPLFLLIPYLLQNQDRFSPLSQILIDDKFPASLYLDELVSEENLSNICDTKPSSDKIIKFSKTKTLSWLSGKVEKVTATLKKENISPGFNSTLSDEEYCRYSCGIVSDYINSALSSDLHDSFGIETINYEEEKPAKKQKICSEQDTKPAKNSISKGKEKAPKISRAQKQLASINTKGMKSMSSFFKKVDKK